MNESDRNVRGAVCSANLAGDDSRLIRVQVNACTQNKWLFGEALCYYIRTFLLADATHGVFFYSFANFNANAFGTKEGTLLKALAEAVSLRHFYSHFSIYRLCNKCSCRYVVFLLAGEWRAPYMIVKRLSILIKSQFRSI